MQRFTPMGGLSSTSGQGSAHRQGQVHARTGAHGSRPSGHIQGYLLAGCGRRRRRQARQQRVTAVVSGCCAAAVAASVVFAMTASASDGRQRRVQSPDPSMLHDAMLANSLVPRLATEGVARDPQGRATTTEALRVNSALPANHALTDQAAVAAYERALTAQRARDAVWDRLAQCETGGNWSMHGSSFSGGLGFYNGTWRAFGGREFAPHAGLATREQQIIVAIRVRGRYGYTGWGCAPHVGL